MTLLIFEVIKTTNDADLDCLTEITKTFHTTYTEAKEKKHQPTARDKRN